MEIKNWDGTQNCVMKGYILKAVIDWNRENPRQRIERTTVDNLMNALRWATDAMTAAEAYRYYQTH